MKDSSCCNDTGLSTWFHPNLVRVVAGIIMITAGIVKFLGGSQIMVLIGSMTLGIFGIKDDSYVNLAMTLGYIAATIEVLGGLSFALGCCKTSKYAALGLAIVMLFALLTRLTNLDATTGTAFDVFSGVLAQVQLELLLFALFAQKSLGVFCCKSGCCGGGKCGKK